MKIDYTKYNFSKFVRIDENSPSGLVWVAPRKYVKSLKYDRVDKKAGNIRDFNKRQKYWVITVFGKSFFCHRIVWLLHNGTVDQLNDVDHIDGNSLNNKISNLREVSPVINSRNAKKKFKTKELQTGVYYEELFSKKGTLLKRFNAHYSDGANNVVKKKFSILKYGYDEALRLAVEWRLLKIKEVNEQGAGYTERHGT